MKAWRLALSAAMAFAWQTVSGEAEHAVFGEPVRMPHVEQKGMAVAMDGSRLFAGAGSTLYAFDVAEPLKPRLLGSLGGFDNLRQIRVRGRFAYVVSRETGMRIVDVSDPAHMQIRSLYDSVEFATGIEVAGNVAFVSERTYGVEAVDVSDPDRPMHITLVKTPESQSCRYRDGYLYSGEWGVGAVTVFDARDMRRFRKVRELPLGGFGDGVDIDGKYLYNRCHLIGYQLAGENANEKNLITGTRYTGTGRCPRRMPRAQDAVSTYSTSRILPPQGTCRASISPCSSPGTRISGRRGWRTALRSAAIRTTGFSQLTWRIPLLRRLLTGCASRCRLAANPFRRRR